MNKRSKQKYRKKIDDPRILSSLNSSKGYHMILLEMTEKQKDIAMEELRKELQEIEFMISEKYYSSNIIIDSVRNRTFKDLLGIYFRQIKNKIDRNNTTQPITAEKE